MPSTLARDLAKERVTELIIYSDWESIVLKPVRTLNAGEYKAFMKEAQKQAAERGMMETDIEEAIKAVRVGE